MATLADILQQFAEGDLERIVPRSVLESIAPSQPFAEFLEADPDDLPQFLLDREFSLADLNLQEVMAPFDVVAQAEEVAAPVFNRTDLPSGVSTSQLGTSFQLAGGTTGAPAATGFPLFERMTDLILRANADKRASIDQTVNLGRFLVDLERVSPTRAARLATTLGLGEGENFDFLNAFGQPGAGPLAAASGGRLTTQLFPQASLPSALSGQELSFLNANPNVANVVSDFAQAAGLPDIFNRSQAGLVPTSSSLLRGLG
jgi:hypothetical protein